MNYKILTKILRGIFLLICSVVIIYTFNWKFFLKYNEMALILDIINVFYPFDSAYEKLEFFDDCLRRRIEKNVVDPRQKEIMLRGSVFSSNFQQEKRDLLLKRFSDEDITYSAIIEKADALFKKYVDFFSKYR